MSFIKNWYLSKNNLFWCWLLLVTFAAFVFSYVLPYAEFTPDDGTWVVDAWLRLKEFDYFTLWISTSQQVNNLPFVSWLFTIPLRISPTILSIQIFIVGIQLVTLVLIKKISQTLKLKWHGLFVGAMFVLLPALTLNYSGRVCNPSFMIFASAFVLWSRLCNEGLKQKYLLAISLIVAIQIHFSFAFYILYFFAEQFLSKSIDAKFEKPLQYIYWCSSLLFGAVYLDLLNLPHIKSLADLTQSASDYMYHRNLTTEMNKPRQAFFPWEMIPLLIPFFQNSKVFQNSKDSLFLTKRFHLLLFWNFSIFFLLALGFIKSWSPHQWMLPWALPYLFLIAVGFERIESFRHGKFLSYLLALCILLSSSLSFYQSLNIIRDTKGVGWHGSNLGTKKAILDFISKNYPGHQIYMASPQVLSNISTNPKLIFEKQMGYVALVTLPGEYRNKVSLGGINKALFIEEGETHGAFENFSELIAKPRGLVQVVQIGSVFLWEGDIPFDIDFWPRITPMEHRLF